MKSQQKKKNNLDFDNPTPEMIKDAETYGLDLKDPKILDVKTVLN